MVAKNDEGIGLETRPERDRVGQLRREEGEIQDPQVMRGDEVAVEEAGKVAVLFADTTVRRAVAEGSADMTDANGSPTQQLREASDVNLSPPQAADRVSPVLEETASISSTESRSTGFTDTTRES